MSTPVLLLNCGSSSIKYQVIDADTEVVVASGIIQRIGEESGSLDHRLDGELVNVVRGFPNHSRALNYLVRVFNAHGPDLTSIQAVGHRTVHGGEAFRSTVVIDGDEITVGDRKFRFEYGLGRTPSYKEGAGEEEGGPRLRP